MRIDGRDGASWIDLQALDSKFVTTRPSARGCPAFFVAPYSLVLHVTCDGEEQCLDCPAHAEGGGNSSVFFGLLRLSLNSLNGIVESVFFFVYGGMVFCTMPPITDPLCPQLKSFSLFFSFRLRLFSSTCTVHITAFSSSRAHLQPT